MLKRLTAAAARFRNPVPALTWRRDAIEGWSLFMGREAAELWLDALASRETPQPSRS